MAADNHAHDLPEGDLDGVGVLEHGQNKLGCDVMGGVAQVNSGHAPATMEVAIFAVAQRRGTALRAVGLDVLTAGDTIFVVTSQDECSTPPPVIYCNQQDRGKTFLENLGSKELQVKSLKQRSYEKMGTSRLSYVSVIAQVGKRGQGNSERTVRLVSFRGARASLP